MGSREAGCGVSESSLAFQRSCGSLGPFTEKDDEARGAGFPRQDHQRAAFSQRVSVLGSRIPSLFGNSPSPGSGIPPPGSPESGIFDRVPCRGRWGAEFSPGFFSLKSRFQRFLPIAFQRSCGLLGERDSLARVTRERDFRKSPSPEGGFSAGVTAERDFSSSPEAGFPRRGDGERDFRPGPAGERNFPHLLFANSSLGAGFLRVPRRGCWGAEFSLAGVAGSGFSLSDRGVSESSLSKKLWIDCWVPSQRRTTKPGERDSPARVTRERDFRKRASVFWSGIRSSEIPPRRAAGFPRRGHRGAGFSTGSPAAGERNFPPPRSREAGFSPAGVKCRGLRVTPFYIVPHG